MEQRHKKVSIVMCTYNGALYLRDQLDSIIAQTYPIYELIIQDDGSTDETCTIINEYINRYSYVHLERNAQQLGVDENFFTALTKATGDYVAIADQDDIWLPNKIELQVAALDANPDALICGHPSLRFYNNQIPYPPYPSPDNKKAIRLEKSLLHGGYAGHSLLIRQTFLSQFYSIVSKEERLKLENNMYYDEIICMTALAFAPQCYIAEYLVLHRRITSAATYQTPRQYKGILNTLSSFFVGLKNFHNPALVAMIQQRFTNISTILKKYQSYTTIDLTNAIIICTELAKKQWINLPLLCALMRVSSIHGHGIKQYILAFIQPITLYSALFAKERKTIQPHSR